MEISPIAGIRAMPVVKIPPMDSELTAVFDIESPARMGDDGYTSSEEEHASAKDDEQAEEQFTESADLDEAERGAAVIPASAGGQISYFA
jgi:hypothetical protein